MNLFYKETDIIDEVSLVYCVHEMYAEKQADTLVLRFKDPKGTWSKWNPAPGDVIRLKEGASDTGKMFLHSMKPENGIFTLRAMSMPRSGTVKKSKSWEGVRFLQLGDEIAEEHGLTFRSYGCEDHVYPYRKQEHAGDFAMFSDLCKLEGCQMLIYDGNLIAYNEQYIESCPPLGTLEVGNNDDFAYTDNRAACFGSCEVSGGSYSGRFDAPGAPTSAVLRPDKPLLVTSDAEAVRFAKGLLRHANKYGRTGQLTKGLLTGFAAASVVDLKTDKASTWDGTVFVHRVRHDYITKKTTLYFRETLEGY